MKVIELVKIRRGRMKTIRSKAFLDKLSDPYHFCKTKGKFLILR